MKNDASVGKIVGRITEKMQQWGITTSFLSAQLGVSRQYAWQIVHFKTALSFERAVEIEQVVDTIIGQERHVATFGDQLRAARVAAGMTLKEVSAEIGCTCVGIARWEKNVCRPRQAALTRLLHLYEHRGRAHRSYIPTFRMFPPIPQQHTRNANEPHQQL